MISKKAAAALPLAILLTLGLSACAPESGSSTPGGDNGDSSQTNGETSNGDQSPETPAAGSLDENGYAIPGQVVNLKLGDSVAYYSYPKLSMDDVQRVTIHSFEYIEKADLPAGKHMDKMKNGVLVLSLSWESVEGKVQSNQSYVKATLDSGEEGRPTAFMDNRLRNGRVDAGATKSGVFTIDIPRGKTTLTIVDYQGAPVARMVIDTSA